MRSTLLTLHDPRLARSFYASGSWQDDTLYMQAAMHAAERPDAFAFQDGRRRLTWSEVTRWADAVAADLHEAGLLSGQRVAVWSPNRVEMIVTTLACSRCGYVVALSFHQNHTTAEVETLLKRISVAALIVQPGYGADADRRDVLRSLASLPTLKRVYAFEAPGGAELVLAGVRPFPGPNAPADVPPVDTNPDKPTYLAFTSGTTGQPKAVLHSDNTLLANGRAMVSDWDLTAQTVIYCLGPLSHHLATIGVELALVAGCEYVTNDVPKGVKPLDRIIESRATYVMGVPTHAIDVQQDMARRGLSRLGDVAVFYMSGAAIPVEVARSFLQMGVTPQNTYGMTEGGSHTTTIPTDTIDTMVQTVGQTCGRRNRCYEIRIWRTDDRDQEVEPGDIGEIGGRGASLMLGYFDNQTATEVSFNARGYFMSGDLGRIDEHGNISIVGRIKDLIIRGGHNIYPAEIENLAIRHPNAAKVAAFPVLDDRLGERVCLAVIPAGDKTIAALDMLAHLDRHGLSRYDMPEYFVVLDEMPLTASGKVLKRELVEAVKRGTLHPVPVRWEAPKPGSSLPRP